MKYLVSIALVVICFIACRKTKDVAPKTQPPAPTDTTTPTPTAFLPWTDTFKGGGTHPSTNYMMSDSVVYFYVDHFTNDSFEITSNATFRQDDDNYDGYPVKHRIKYSKAGVYYLSAASRKIVFKQDSILFSWTYYYEVKSPTGGVHSDTYTAYGKQISIR